MGAGGLRAYAQFAFPHGIGEYKFGSQHPVAVFGVAVNVAVFQFCASFRLDVSAEGLLPVPGAIEVNAQLAYLAYIVDVGVVFGYRPVVYLHPLAHFAF